MLVENKFSKYLLYAIGEIVLVVIGILIAVSINNLNERNRKSVVDSLLLNEIKHNLETDLEYITDESQAFEKYYRSQSYIIDWLESDLEFNDSLSIHLNQSYYRGYFTPNRIPYEALKQDGIKPEENDNIKSKVSVQYDFSYTQHIYFLELYEKEAYSYYEACLQHFTELGFYNKSSKPIDSIMLKSDKGFISKLKTLRNLNQYLRRNIMNSTKRDIENTLSIFEENQ